jgi:cyclohexanone monooxygenase
VTRIEPTAAAEEAWIETIRSAGYQAPDFYNNCTPGYYNNEGQSGVTIWDESYSPGPAAFNDLMQAWRDKGDLEGLDLK